eukprot:ctg_129.g91
MRHTHPQRHCERHWKHAFAVVCRAEWSSVRRTPVCEELRARAASVNEDARRIVSSHGDFPADPHGRGARGRRGAVGAPITDPSGTLGSMSTAIMEAALGGGSRRGVGRRARQLTMADAVGGLEARLSRQGDALYSLLCGRHGDVLRAGQVAESAYASVEAAERYSGEVAREAATLAEALEVGASASSGPRTTLPSRARQRRCSNRICRP